MVKFFLPESIVSEDFDSACAIGGKFELAFDLPDSVTIGGTKFVVGTFTTGGCAFFSENLTIGTCAVTLVAKPQNSNKDFVRLENFIFFG